MKVDALRPRYAAARRTAGGSATLAHRQVAPPSDPPVVDVRDQPSVAPAAQALAGSPRRRVASTLAAAVLAIDAVAVLAATTAVAVVAGGITVAGAALLVFGWLLVMFRLGGYDRRTLLEHSLRTERVLDAVARVGILIAVIPLIVPGVTTTTYVAALILTGTLTALGRARFARAVRSRQAAGHLRVPAVLRGDAAAVTSLLAAMERDAQPFDVLAVQVTSGSVHALPTVPATEEPAAAAVRTGATTLMMVGAQPDAPDDLRRRVWTLESAGIQVQWVPLPTSVATPSVLEIGHTGLPVLALEERDLAPERSLRKVVIDRVVATLACVLLAPVFLLAAMAIRLDSSGPILFQQVRIGRGGRRFTMLKFRTMGEGAEAELERLAHLNVHEGGTLFKIPDDPRVTRVGAFLRKYSLDELPQLINVARGDMSLVGPRPPLPGEVANYAADLHRRFLVRPGLTGLWQVSGRSDLDPVESARLDAYYVELWTPAMDAWIVLKTIKVVLAGDGAY